MNIFKAYLKVIPSHFGATIMVIVIFTLLLALSINGSDGLNGGADSIDGFVTLIAVNDKDNTEESRAFVSYLENSPNFTMVKDIDFDEENAVQDSLYYRKTEYVLTVNKGFSEMLGKIGSDGADISESLLSSQVIGGSAMQVFAENRINSYIAAVRLYIKGGFDTKAACIKAAETLEKGVKVSSFTSENSWDSDNTGAYMFYNYMPYILLMMLMGILVPTFTSFLSNEIRGRSLCAPISPAAYMTQVIFGAFVVCFGAVALLFAAGTVITGGSLFHENNFYSLIQLFVYMLFCLALSAFVGILEAGSEKTSNYITSMVSNVVGLGMSFLCGVFVKQSLLGESILNVAKFLPAYWYVRANNMIMSGDGQVFNEGEIWAAIGIQGLFAAALFAGTILAAQIKKGRGK